MRSKPGMPYHPMSERSVRTQTSGIAKKELMEEMVIEQAAAVKLEEESYEFTGRHLVANYFECDHEAMIQTAGIIDAMKRAVMASGATLLEASQYIFPGDGMTAAMLLSESHASIHTYPEHNSCFIDLFTCGHTCSAEKFDEVMRQHLRPARVSYKLLRRHQHIEEDSFTQANDIDLNLSGLSYKIVAQTTERLKPCPLSKPLPKLSEFLLTPGFFQI